MSPPEEVEERRPRREAAERRKRARRPSSGSKILQKQSQTSDFDMGKSSSSRNKKSQRLSLRKRGRSRSKTTKSKKLRRRNDSLSYSDDDSGTSISVLSSSSEDRSRSSRGRTRTRKDSKGTKKRARKQSYSPQRNDDFSRMRKRKGLKRGDDYKEKKKTNRRKKRKRNPSITSTSGSDCSDESEFERQRGRLKIKENHKRKLEEVKSGRKKSRYRSRSCSSGDQCSQDSDCQIEEERADEKNSRRLRSVIVVVGDEIVPKELGKDGHKEEITYDRDEYPCRSNDSNDGGSKWEMDSYSHDASKIETVVENEKGEVVSYVRNSKLMDMEKDYEFQNEGSGTSHDGVGTKDPTNDSINGNDLESILRQKALENLKRFKGGTQRSDTKNPTNPKDESVNTKQPSIDKVESVSVRRQDSTLSRGKISDRSDHSSEFKDDIFPSDQMAVAGNSDKKGDLGVCAATNKTNLVISRQGLSKNDSTLKQPHASQEPIQAKPEETNNECGSGAPEPASCASSISGEKSLRKSQSKTQESSQFEQKTMSVMRGGDMVQVSYKVYIPKKAPALSRRQLKR